VNALQDYLRGGNAEVDINLGVEGLIGEEVWMQVLAVLHV